MRTFLGQISGTLGRIGKPVRALTEPRRGRLRRPSPQLAGQEGFLLVEVMISALLVALIVVATFNGFDVANRVSADQRRHSEAALLAAESQEQLRSDSAGALDALESSAHSYTRAVSYNGNSTTYTITQEAKALSAKDETGCSVAGAGDESGTNFEIVSSITWKALGERPPVRQSAVVTPPVGSALEVDVTNGAATPEPVPGITAAAQYQPVESASLVRVHGTTGAAGCVVLTGLATTSATVEIEEKLGFITTAGLLKYPTKTVEIAPSLTTRYPVTYAAGGSLTAEFTYKGETTWSGKAVTSDTFVAQNTKVPAGYSNYQVGSTAFEYQTTGEQLYKAKTGSYASTASTATDTKYPYGDLFPFPNEWVVYAGDCPVNNVGAVAEVKHLVRGEATEKARVPLSLVELNVMSGAYANRATATREATAYEVTTYDPECESYPEEPEHAFAANLKHTQKTNSTGLENPFQPFGKQDLCLYNKTAKKTYRTSYTLSSATPTSKTIYIGQTSKKEHETTEKAESAKWKSEGLSSTSRKSNEKALKESFEKEETEAEQATGVTIASEQSSC